MIYNHTTPCPNSFTFSDLRRIIAKAALSENFDAVYGNYLKALKKSFVDTLLRKVA
ncbi:MAG: hypothetical protein JRI32_09765 [Deltaproteobacteria bacterium]|nr:hypothetical protein [Deltaproteobacteria bacterium]